tara:strand:- start:1755 stop:2039 length:285 start_codon:yes stop_codon:yes gene_type:complete
MITNILLLIFLIMTWSFLVSYIKNIKISNYNNETSWMFSYDFKTDKKKDYQPERSEILRKRRFKNKLIFILYINVILIFLVVNSLVSQFLIILT